MGAVEGTTIKFQKLENVGYDAGLLLGYEFNRKFSVETGFFINKKIYYSEGKYFNSSKLYLTQGVWIKEVSGYCKMYEIPLNLKYTLSSTQKKSWFVTAGATSYLMREENYDYMYASSAGQWPKHKEYKHPDNYFFSALQFSGGYTHKMGNVGDLRIEPYLKLPLTGMGVGKLPFLSAGLQLGITRKMF